MTHAWFSVVLPTLVAGSVILVPGLIASMPLRMPLLARICVSGAFGITVIGVAGIGAELARVRFSLLPVLVTSAVVGLLLWMLRRRMPSARQEPIPMRARGWVVLAWAVAVAGIVWVAFRLVPDPQRISQTYDNVFHLAAIAHILEQGDASSLTLRTLIETAQTWSFYPSGWHSVVALTAQLSGVDVPVAVNASWIAVAAAIWGPGAAWLAVVLLPQYDRILVACVATLVSGAFAAMPYSLLTWGTLYPTFLATALLPAAIAAPLSLRPLRRDAPPGTGLPFWVSVSATAGALIALCFSQPRVLATWAVLIAPFVLASAATAYRSARRQGGREARVARGVLIGALLVVVVVAAAGFLYAVVRLGLFERPLEDRLSGPQAQATQSVLDGLIQVAVHSWPTGVHPDPTVPAILLALAVLTGLIVAARRRGSRWIVVSYAAVAILYVLAAGADDVVTKLLTGLWYKDRYRLSAALPVLGVTLATLGILTAGRVFRRRFANVVSISLAVVTALTAAMSLALGGLSRDVAFVFRLPATAASSEVVSAAQIEFLRAIAGYIPSDQRVLGDPWDGSALSLLYGDREPVFPHVNGQWDPHRVVLATRLGDIATDPAVCTALNELRVRFVLYAPHEFGGGDPSGNKFAAIHDAVEQGLFTQVASDGDSMLLRIDQCGPLE